MNAVNLDAVNEYGQGLESCRNPQNSVLRKRVGKCVRQSSPSVGERCRQVNVGTGQALFGNGPVSVERCGRPSLKSVIGVGKQV